MEKVRLIIISLLLLGLFLPYSAHSQVISKTPAHCNITIDGTKTVFDDATVKITQSGNLQVKATFTLSDMYSEYIPQKGKTKIEIERLAVNVFDPRMHFTAMNVHGIVDSSGVVTVVYNWQLSEMDL